MGKVLSRKEFIAAKSKWAHTFGRALYEATGRWNVGSEMYGVLTTDYMHRVAFGAAAHAEYAAAPAESLIILVEKEGAELIECPRGRKPPLVDFIDEDFYVFPPDIAWTLVTHHEEFVGERSFPTRRRDSAQPNLSVAVRNAWHNGETGTVSLIQPSWSRVDGRRVLPRCATRV